MQRNGSHNTTMLELFLELELVSDEYEFTEHIALSIQHVSRFIFRIHLPPSIRQSLELEIL